MMTDTEYHAADPTAPDCDPADCRATGTRNAYPHRDPAREDRREHAVEEAQVSEAEIQKFALIEGKSILSVHCVTIFKWASQADTLMAEKTQAALLETIARMYQIVEGMPLTQLQRKN